VSKIYKPDITALTDVSFEVATGEFIFLVGPSGAGKSTLIRLLIRQELPTEGSIMFDDTDVVALKKSLLPFYRQQIGVVFQDFKLIDVKTVRENIEFALEITGKPDEEITETTESLLDVVGLTDRQHLFPEQLSGGEKQRAGIARALANDPKLLIADEPTGNLDPQTSLEIIKILQTINEWGTTIMIATHDKEIVDILNKRVVRLENGTVASDHVGGYGQSCGTSTKPVAKQTKGTPTTKEEKPAAKPLPSELETLNLPADIIQTFAKNGIDSIDHLLDMTEGDIENIDGIGPKKTETVIKALESFVSENPTR